MAYPSARRQPAPSLAGASPGRRPRQEAALERPDQALELAHALAQGRVLVLELGERGGRRLGARLPPAGDAAPGGTDPLRASTRQRPTTDPAQTRSGGVRTSPGATSGPGLGEDPCLDRRGSWRAGARHPWVPAMPRERGSGAGYKGDHCPVGDTTAAPCSPLAPRSRRTRRTRARGPCLRRTAGTRLPNWRRRSSGRSSRVGSHLAMGLSIIIGWNPWRSSRGP